MQTTSPPSVSPAASVWPLTWRRDGIEVIAALSRHSLAPHAVSAAARRLAERVASRLIGGVVRVACLLPSGRPVVQWPHDEAGCLVSLAHTRSLLAAAACRGGADVGIDVVATTESSAALAWCCADADSLDGVPETFRVSIWAAKEAAYKASRIDIGFQPRRVRITPLDDAGFRWVVATDFGTVRGVGRWYATDGHVVAIAVRPQPSPQSQENVLP